MLTDGITLVTYLAHFERSSGCQNSTDSQKLKFSLAKAGKDSFKFVFQHVQTSKMINAFEDK